LIALPTEPSKAAHGQSKCQSQQVDTSMFMQVEVDEELVNLRGSRK
jgi:hypothetical protein